jgi:hypothetical protein
VEWYAHQRERDVALEREAYERQRGHRIKLPPEREKLAVPGIQLVCLRISEANDSSPQCHHHHLIRKKKERKKAVAAQVEATTNQSTSWSAV